MKKTIMPRGNPRCMYHLLDQLEHLTGVEKVIGPRLLRERRSRKFLAQIQYYDRSSRVLRVRTNYRTFIAYFQLRIDPNQREAIEEFIKSYSSN